jgi:hypothetical protein
MILLIRGECIKNFLLYIIERSVIVYWQDKFLRPIYQAQREIFDAYLLLFLCLGYRQTQHVEGIERDRNLVALDALHSRF